LEPRCHGLCGSQVFACLIRRSAKRSSGADVAMRARFKPKWQLLPLREAKKIKSRRGVGTSKFFRPTGELRQDSKNKLQRQSVRFTGASLSCPMHKSHTSLVCRRQKGRRRSRSLAPAVGLRAIGEIVVNELPLILYSAPCHFYDAFGDAVRFRRVSALDEGAQLQH